MLHAESASRPVREAAADLLATMPSQVLPQGTRRRLAGQHGHRTVIAHRLSTPVVGDPPAVTRLLDALVAAATGRHHDDGLAPRLVRQALFSTDSDMRVVAANVLRTSPFRDAIADALAELLIAPLPGTDAVTEAALINLLGSLGAQRHRPALERLLCAAPDRAAAASFALAHMPGGTDLAAWRRVLADHGAEGHEPLHRAVLYAVAMNRDRAALTLLRTSATTSPDVARRARWWLDLPEALISSART